MRKPKKTYWISTDGMVEDLFEALEPQTNHKRMGGSVKMCVRLHCSKFTGNRECQSLSTERQS